MPARTRPHTHAKTSATAATILAAVITSPMADAQGPLADWTPTSREVVLNTEFTQINTSIGVVSVSGGVFVFRNVHIPKGVTVRGVGKNPLVFILSGNMQIDGAITVRGGQGQRVDTLNSANFPAGGGVGNCGGGSGGQGSPNRTDRSFSGGTGYGPLQIGGFGGRGGRINCANAFCGIGSGGGGGVFATAGDPWYKLKATLTFVQPNGAGGYGCRSRSSTTLPGGAPGLPFFRDNDPGNDFFGIGYDVNRRRFVLGELPLLVGGSGGGGGGDYALSCATNDVTFYQDEKGGGGGAGGGCLIIAASGAIQINRTGRIDANGGDGGGGAWAGSCNRAGGGGGGAGGMIVLYTQRNIEIEIHGETYAKNDYDFAVSADGGVGLLDVYGSGSGKVRGKYDPAPNVANMNARPSGAFGGMGLVQFMAPPYNPIPDGTNTVLDDNIILRDPVTRQVLRGAEKQRYLAWRGFPDAQGVWRDDQGNRVNIGDNEGDIRPTPILLPVL